ncbi:ATP-dependent zinc metalloprotease FTSH 11 [Chlorella vulgaris]
MAALRPAAACRPCSYAPPSLCRLSTSCARALPGGRLPWQNTPRPQQLQQQRRLAVWRRSATAPTLATGGEGEEAGNVSASTSAATPAEASSSGASQPASRGSAPQAQPTSESPQAAASAASGVQAEASSSGDQPGPAWLKGEPSWLTAMRIGGDATASVATGGLSAAAGGDGSGPQLTVMGALAAFFRVLGDTLRVLLRLLVVEPLSWLLNRSGLLAIRAADVVQHLERTNRVAPLDADAVAAALRVLNKQHPTAAAEFVERNCLAGGGGQAAGSTFAVNAAVAREYITALVKTGRLSQYGDSAAAAAPSEGQSHRSLPQLLAELQVVAGGSSLTPEPGASLARPLHVIVRGQEKAASPLSWISSFFWSCVGVLSILYIMTAGAATFRRLQGSSGPVGMPGNPASVATASGSGGMFAAKEYNKEDMPEKSVKKFTDVKGCDEAIAELAEIVEYLKHPEKFTRLGGKLPKGVLLTGLPGTGKTLLARAVAGEAGVPFFYKAGSEFDEMFVGVGSRRVRSLFAAAKKKAPCIIFIDEIDAMGGKRTNWESSGGSRKTLNQLLTDMDGFEENSGVVVVAATNLPELLDPALTRPGRFDRQVAVTLPDVKGRQQIIDLYLKGKPVTADVDTELLARRTPGFSGAELANLVNESALLAARYDRDAISLNLLDEARDKILMGTPRIITQSDEARKLTAYHEGGHALVALYTPGAKPIHKATIVPRGHALGMVSQVPEKDEYSTTRQQMMAHIDVCMGGKAAEAMIFGEDQVTSGATSDLRQATRMARHMVMECGMNERIGPVSVGEEQSPSTRQAVDAEVETMLKGAYQRVVGLLREKEGELHALAQALLETETLTLADIQSLVLAHNSPELPGGPAGGGGGSGGGSEGRRTTAPAPTAAAASRGVGDAAAPAPAPAAAAAAAAAASAPAASPNSVRAAARAAAARLGK